MIRTSARVVILLAGLAAASLGESRRAEAGNPDLFYNYYVGPARGYYPGIPAQMYISPRPTPPHVGHTYITYQPLMPHEFMVKHHRTYYRYYPSGGHTSVHVHWW